MMNHVFLFFTFMLIMLFLFEGTPDLWSTLAQQRDSYIQQNYITPENKLTMKPPIINKTCTKAGMVI